MRKSVLVGSALALVAVLGFGCAGPETKLGRGLSDMTEVVRGGEFQRSTEQGALFDGPDTGLTTGMIRGFDKTVARTGVGVFEVVTFPIPRYTPYCTNYLTPNPEYPDGYAPRKWSDAMFDTDHESYFSGGDVAPWFPGSRFRVFDN